MNAFFQELFHAGIYKRSQGRITRQITWAAMAITVALGLWRLSDNLVGWDPAVLHSRIHAQAAGKVEYSAGEAGERIVRIVDAQGTEIEAYRLPEGAAYPVKAGETVEPGAILADSKNLLALGVIRYGLPGVLLAAGLWAAYRIVNVPSFADFLIAVEAEMNKVSWPTRHELFRASMVVLFTIFVLAIILFMFDLIWQKIFTWLRIFS